jgi:hypothetical protein
MGHPHQIHVTLKPTSLTKRMHDTWHVLNANVNMWPQAVAPMPASRAVMCPLQSEHTHTNTDSIKLALCLDAAGEEAHDPRRVCAEQSWNQ